MKKQFRILSFIIAMIFIMISCVPMCFAAGNQKTIRIGYIDYKGFIEKQDNGNYGGYAVQYLNEIAKYTGWKYEYIHGTWADLMEQLKEGKIDFLCQAQKSDEREKEYLFSKYSCGQESNVLYTKSENKELYYNDFENFNGIRVAMMEGSFQNQTFSEFAKRKGFSYIPVYFPNEEECFNALNKNEVDAVAMGSLAKKTEYKVISRFGSDAFYFITNKQSVNLIDDINDAMDEILSAKPYYSMQLYNDYYSKSESANLNLTKDELEYIRNAGVITVGQLRNRYTFSSIDKKTEELEGINEDLLEVISKMTGLKFKSVPVDLNAKPIDDLRMRKFDMVMGILRTENFLSDSSLRLSNCYLESTLTVVMRSGEIYNPKQKYKVALKTAFQAMQEYIKANYPQYETKYYSDDEDSLKALLKGDVDLMMQNVYTMNYLLQKPQYSSLEMLPTTFLTEQNCMATLFEYDPRLISIMNKAILALDSDTVNQVILANTTAKPYQLTAKDVFYKYRIQFIILVFLLLLCFFMLGTIIIARKKNEVILQSKNKQLAEAVTQADRANTAKSEFLSRMSHEIRTPLNAIVGLTAIAKMNENDTLKVDDYLEKIETSSRVLLGIINDVLDMSAIESNKLKIANETFDIKQLLIGITTIYYPQCVSKGIRFVMATDLKNEIFVGDSLRINQILLNLISNAYKFTDKDGVISVNIKETACKGKTAFIRFIVSDTGAGMTQEMQQRLFKPFEQETASTAKHHGGSGLGLSIAKNLVDMMHGAIKVESEKGKGTTFTVDIPLEIANEHSEVNNEILKEIKILIVDDDKTSLDYASIVLSRIGTRFETASSGKEALIKINKSRENKNPYDVVMIDWKMPDMDGVELTRRIREKEESRAMIIIVSAYDLNQVEEEAKSAGADHFVSKPLFQSTVFDVLMNLSHGEIHTDSAKKDDFDFTGHKVLLAEDNELNSEIAIELLNMVNLEVEHAKNGKIAISMFENSKPNTYDAILMDIQMPEVNGYEATKAIRNLERDDAKTIPIIAMTANAFSEDVAKALSCGMNGHIAKPIDTKILYKTLETAIKNGKQQGEN